MGFSSQQYHKEQQERKWRVHPAWRGIGCILFLLIPIMSWFGTIMIFQSGIKIPLLWEMTKIVTLPYVHISFIDRLSLQINKFFIQIGLMTGQLYLTILLSVVGFGILAFLYAVLYRVAGPPRYGPFDVPPSSVRR